MHAQACRRHPTRGLHPIWLLHLLHCSLASPSQPHTSICLCAAYTPWPRAAGRAGPWGFAPDALRARWPAAGLLSHNYTCTGAPANAAPSQCSPAASRPAMLMGARPRARGCSKAAAASSNEDQALTRSVAGSQRAHMCTHLPPTWLCGTCQGCAHRCVVRWGPHMVMDIMPWVVCGHVATCPAFCVVM